MYSKCWLVIRDDSKKTFEVCGMASNDNRFSNTTYAMQKVGMNVTYLSPPVTNKFSSKESIKMIGYTKEYGLYDRLMKQFNEIMINSIEED